MPGTSAAHPPPAPRSFVPMTGNTLLRTLTRPFAGFFQQEAASGAVLLVVSVLSLILANTEVGIARYFPAVWATPVRLAVGSFGLTHTLLEWINDGLMTIFFLIVGLEIKREVLAGELSTRPQAALPAIAAVGGMVVPALLYAAFNAGTATAGGWGIPMATDIAFALAILHLLGRRVPVALRVFVAALAIIDDLGAVLVIALFYTKHIAWVYLGLAAGLWGALLLLGRAGIRSLTVYVGLGLVLWWLLLESGVHATLAGVLLAAAVPFRARAPRAARRAVLAAWQRRHATLATDPTDPDAINADFVALADAAHLLDSPARRLEGRLHGVVAFGVVPLFAFANTSLVIEPGVVRELASPLGLGVLLGLLVGKPLGIGGAMWTAVRAGWATVPTGTTWRQLAGASLLGGIGFTMSIFITLLALPGAHEQDVAKAAILLASAVAGVAGYGVLRMRNEE